MPSRRALAASLLTLGLAANSLVFAQETYPNKPIRIVVGFAPGGATDVLARLLAQEISVTLGQAVYIENRAGANSLIATQLVANAAPDGYTFLFASQSHTVNPHLLSQPKYDPIKSFDPVMRVAVLPQIVVTAPSNPANTLEDLVAAAKGAPGKISYGSAGNGGAAHLAGATLAHRTRTDMVHVPFRGNAPALVDVMAGNVSFMFYAMAGIQDYIAQKKLKVLAVAAPTRLKEFPDVPTTKESGVAGLEAITTWLGVFAPAGTPQAAVSRINEAMQKALEKPAVEARFRSMGALVVGGSPGTFKSFLVEDNEVWQRVVSDAGLKKE
ncbi:tripartite tricarboxylate transporter substrate binding protein [Hydrogenophaga sp.]|uniref:Bug family tripartite tricarboxylate transporter substrate binding protein n=1 Tax=Hydrogenophaga sp. TaxID=1904254 RepID=UPI00271EB757|nr:tripartite tricarboxylate transporter substrate binding protein [Hydrogenophaga sp.]MDO9436681.1 tripartite tricarboxylate transporter substrate binding protein [Hydrogenophaga sp.]